MIVPLYSTVPLGLVSTVCREGGTLQGTRVKERLLISRPTVHVIPLQSGEEVKQSEDSPVALLRAKFAY